MPESRIFDIPFAFKATAIPKGCRLERTLLVRDAAPAEISMIRSEDAPHRLSAELFDGTGRCVQKILLRHDGTSYLRLAEKLPQQAGGSLPPYTVDDFERLLQWRTPPWPCRHGRKDAPVGFLTTATDELIESKEHGYRALRMQPSDLLTFEGFSATVRRWVSHDREAAMARALKTASEIVFVDGDLHRRVGTPVLMLTKDLPRLLHSDQIDEHRKNRVKFVSIGLADVLPKLPAHHGAAGYRCVIDAPLEMDYGICLGGSARMLMKQCQSAIEAATPDLSCEGLQSFLIWRESFDEALLGDDDSALVAVEVLRALACAKPYRPSARIDQMKAEIVDKLQLFDDLSSHHGTRFTALDLTALRSLAS